VACDKFALIIWHFELPELCRPAVYNLKTTFFKYKMRPKGITRHTGTAPHAQLFVILKKVICHCYLSLSFISGDI